VSNTKLLTGIFFQAVPSHCLHRQIEDPFAELTNRKMFKEI